MVSKTIYGWLLECIYIQRNAAGLGWAGADMFLQIKQGLREATGMSDQGFENWLERIKKYGKD